MDMQIRNCVFGFKCDKKWENLTTTENMEVRFCNDCRREVFFCRTDAQLREAILYNRCVTIERINPTTKKMHQLTGSPVRPTDMDDDTPF